MTTSWALFSPTYPTMPHMGGSLRPEGGCPDMAGGAGHPLVAGPAVSGVTQWASRRTRCAAFGVPRPVTGSQPGPAW
jgi:hypothetical protein